MDIYLNNKKSYSFDGKETKYFNCKGSEWDIEEVRLMLSGEFNKEKILQTETKDFSCELLGSRYRCQLFHVFNSGWTLTLRNLPVGIPTWHELGFNDEKKAEILSLTSGPGLLLFCGSVSSGKSTTMTKVIDELATDTFGTIITIEDPIEYINDKTTIKQREIDVDTRSFASGIIEARRQTPRLIALGEIRSSEIAKVAVEVALDGVMVLATLHAQSVQNAISKFWSFLDDQGDEQFVDSLQGIMAQHLIRGNNRTVCAFETLLIDDAVKNTLKNVLTDKSNINLLSHAQRNQKRLSFSEQRSYLLEQGVKKEQINHF